MASRAKPAVADPLSWFTRTGKRGRSEMDRRVFLAALGTIVVVALVAALYLVLVSNTAAQGRHIQQLQLELSRIRRENEQLEVEIAREASIERLWKRAVELGFEFLPVEMVEFVRAAGE